MVQESNIETVASIFFKEPNKEHYLKQIAKDIALAHTSVKNYLILLKNENIIFEIKQKRGSRIFPTFKANISHKSYKSQKIIYNFKSILLSGIISHIEEKVMPSSIVIFGSYQKGEDLEDSDIDIFIEAEEESLDLKKFERFFGRKIQLHWKSSIKSYAKELKNNIANGWVVQGYLEIV